MSKSSSRSQRPAHVSSFQSILIDFDKKRRQSVAAVSYFLMVLGGGGRGEGESTGGGERVGRVNFIFPCFPNVVLGSARCGLSMLTFVPHVPKRNGFILLFSARFVVLPSLSKLRK